MNINEPYKASMTREQFLFHEMRTVAQLLMDGKEDNEIFEIVFTDNLFQYPTEKSIKRTVKNCLKRLRLLEDVRLIEIIAKGSSDSAKQVCLYAMMNQYRVIYEFMTNVIGEKFRLKDFSFTRKDLNVFFSHLQEQNDVVAAWSDATIQKIKQVIVKMLVDTEYLDNPKSDILHPVLIDFDFKNILVDKRDYVTLSVFNCFEGELL
ncbi:DUF1819 family protein [Amedibacillus dolichus]|uniref:DUF1819 family protein n=1 Tax=Amedibacillus dolichus TaxID=31971 RepID=A0A415PP47_9FIRM|nr:DUF1819 family protein [Amedibacillus dolichus]RHM14503.1 DUF1819 family protein [Amedibacillus dolichus]